MHVSHRQTLNYASDIYILILVQSIFFVSCMPCFLIQGREESGAIFVNAYMYSRSKLSPLLERVN